MYKKFSQDSSFKEHIKNMQKRWHTNSINVKKIFSEESSLKKHIKNTDEKPYQCIKCKKGFSQTKLSLSNLFYNT